MLVGELTSGPKGNTIKPLQLKNQWGVDAAYNMTQYPEVVLAREMELCYANISYITDYDVAAKEVIADEIAKPVSHRGVLQAFAADSPAILKVVRAMVDHVTGHPNCGCSSLEEART
ncbi:hypothetical protein J5278_19750 [Rhizobium sp. B21/90]|nr:hypothetical protein J5278_19750 [Rhizobium sp. B21/90]